MTIPPVLQITTKSFTVDRSSYAKARMIDMARGIGPLAGIVWAAVVILYFVITDDPALKTTLLIAIVCIALLYLAMFAVVLQKIFSKTNQRLCSTPRTFEFTDVSVYGRMEGLGETRFSWELITSISHLPGWTLLKQDMAVAVAVPDSAFASSVDVAAFKDLIRKKSAERKTTRRRSRR